MKGTEQLARSCRRLGREGVGAKRAGTLTGAARAPGRKPWGATPRPSPHGPTAAALAPLGAELRAPMAGEVELTAVSPLSLLGFWGCWVFFGGWVWVLYLRGPDPLFGAGCPWPRLLRGFFASFICGCAGRLLLLVLLIAPGPFLALCESAV